MKFKIKPSSLFLCSFILLLKTKVFAAACCGGGFAAPSLIVGDDKAQFTSSYSYSEITDDVGTSANWHKRSELESGETIKIEAAHIISDRWQTGFSVPVIQRSRGDESSAGLGDISGTLGYEYLPDWDYSPWRPKGLGYFQITLPTGKSIQDSDTASQLDTRGRGFWAIGAGTILTKIIGRWDLYSSLDVHRSFAKNYSNSQSEGRLKPGYGTNLGIGAGYNLSSLRLGSSLTWTYEDPIDVSGTLSSNGSPQRFATAAISASYLFANEWASTLTYSDQTLFGKPTNTSLSQSTTIFLQKRWLR